MAYHKITDGNVTLTSSYNKGPSQSELRSLAMSTSFWFCPKCKNEDLGFSDGLVSAKYICSKCGWTFQNTIYEDDGEEIKNGYGMLTDVNKLGIIGGALKKD